MSSKTFLLGCGWIPPEEKAPMIRIDSEKCVGCNACIRSCPVNDANIAQTVNGRNIISINDNNCIHCGECTKICSHNARFFDDDTTSFFADLKRKPIAVLVTPAVKVAFKNNWHSVLHWLREQHNVAGIYDVSFGADICTYMHLKAVKEKKVKKIIYVSCNPSTLAKNLNHLQRDYVIKYVQPIDMFPNTSGVECVCLLVRK